MDYTTLPTTDVLQKTMDALKSRGINPELVQTKEEALARLQILIPDGVTLMTGASVTLQQIDFEALLISGKHPWKNLKDQILAEKDPQMQRTLRKQGILADYFLGSVKRLGPDRRAGQCQRHRQPVAGLCLFQRPCDLGGRRPEDRPYS